MAALAISSSACQVYDASLVEGRARRGDVRSSDSSSGEADGGERDGGRDARDARDAIDASDASGMTCGDGVVEEGESCDTAIERGEEGSCPNGCSGGSGCERNVYEGESCQARCVVHLLTQRKPDDGCCPDGADHASDLDCPAECGNGQVEPGESCDPPETCKKPENCQPENACERAVYSGQPSQCSSNCEMSRVESCESGDGCCPTGCDFASDDDCEPPAPPFDCATAHVGDAATACRVCDCERCGSEVSACLTGEYGDRCGDVVDCAERERCVGQACYCGSANLEACESMHNGKCAAEIETVRFNSPPSLLLLGFGNTSFPIGRASAVTSCRAEKCKDACGL